jgi:RNA polymerase sigma factor (sigma-70 family)
LFWKCDIQFAAGDQVWKIPVINSSEAATNCSDGPSQASAAEASFQRGLQVIDWQAIIEEHGPSVWQTAYRLLGNRADAADCFQETFVSALEVCRRQRVRNFSALLIRLATARAIDQLRQRFRQRNVNSCDLPAAHSTNPGPVQVAQQHKLAAGLCELLGKLPAREAQAFCLRYLNDMSYRQIANELGIKTNAAGVLLHRAKARLRECFESSVKAN